MDQCIDYNIGVLITQYELGQLSDEERDRFEEHLVDCDFCSAEISKMESIVDAINEARPELVERLHAQGIKYHSGGEEPQAQKSPVGGRELLFDNLLRLIDQLLRPRIYVPSLVAISVIAFFLILPPAPPQPDSPYLKYLAFEKAPYSHVRSAEMVSWQELFIEGMEYYLANDYKAAIVNLQNATELNPNVGKWWLYLGVSYFMNHEADPAIATLTKAEALTGNTLNRRARWYLAQSYLLSNNMKSVKPILDSLVAQDEDYAVEAAELLEKLSTHEAVNPP